MKRKTIKLNDEALTILKGQREAFKAKFGIEPGQNDPLFFDPDYDVPTKISDEKLRKGLIDADVKAGVDPEKVLKHFGF